LGVNEDCLLGLLRLKWQHFSNLEEFFSTTRLPGANQTRFVALIFVEVVLLSISPKEIF